MTEKKTEREIIAYYDGCSHTLVQWAWWKDGVQYVGCGIYTLNQIIAELNQRRENELVVSGPPASA
jgi:hypothetical protein